MAAKDREVDVVGLGCTEQRCGACGVVFLIWGGFLLPDFFHFFCFLLLLIFVHVLIIGDTTSCTKRVYLFFELEELGREKERSEERHES